MDDALTNLFTVIISAVTATTTIVAVFIALWQTKWPHQVKLHIKCNVVTSHYQSGESLFKKERKLSLEIYNIGLVDASILCWGIELDKKHKFVVQYFGNQLQHVKTKSFIRKSIPLSLFQTPVQITTKNIYNKRKIQLFVQEVNGKTFKQKMSLSTKTLVEMKPNDFCSNISEEEFENAFYNDIDLMPLEECAKEHNFTGGK